MALNEASIPLLLFVVSSATATFIAVLVKIATINVYYSILSLVLIT